MKRVSLIVLFTLIVIIFIKYYSSSYEIKYKIDEYELYEKYDSDKFYFEIKDNEGYIYNFKIYDKRKLGKKVIDSFQSIVTENYKCIHPKSKDFETYPLCVSDMGEIISYDLIEDGKIKEYVDKLNIKFKSETIDENKEFEFMDNTDDEDIIAVWKYNGFYILDSDEVKTINLFRKDRYSNELSILHKNIIFLPNYDEDLFFTSFILLNIETGEYKTYKTKYEISYDAYITGTFKNNIYLFDKKSEVVYSVNVKNGKISIFGSEDKGYKKIENKKQVKADIKEYTNDKITYFNEVNKDILIYGQFRYYSENEKIKTKFTNYKNFKVVHTYKDKIYFIKDDNLYMYNSKNSEKVLLHYFELNFNDSNRIFIYNN